MEGAERERMGANGRALVSRRFAWPVIAAEMAGVYRWVAGKGPKPASVTAP
jgi:glycosyltransferase involved in cell wall biosynthesis